MRIAEHGDPVRRHRKAVLDCPHQHRPVLMRQAVDNVEIDGRNAEISQRGHDVSRLLEALRAVDGGLYDRFEVLHADACPRDAEGSPCLQALGVDMGRVDFDTDLGVWSDVEVSIQRAAQSLQILRADDRRRTAAEMDGADLAPLGQAPGNKPDLLVECIEIGDDRVVAAHLFGMAAAIEAEPIAERDVQIERQRAIRPFAKPLPIDGFVDAVVEVWRCGVAGIARYRSGVAGDEFGVHGVSFRGSHSRARKATL